MLHVQNLLISLITIHVAFIGYNLVEGYKIAGHKCTRAGGKPVVIKKYSKLADVIEIK